MDFTEWKGKTIEKAHVERECGRWRRVFFCDFIAKDVIVFRVCLTRQLRDPKPQHEALFMSTKTNFRRKSSLREDSDAYTTNLVLRDILRTSEGSEEVKDAFSSTLWDAWVNPTVLIKTSVKSFADCRRYEKKTHNGPTEGQTDERPNGRTTEGETIYNDGSICLIQNGCYHLRSSLHS